MCTGEVPFRGRDTLSTLTALAVHRPRPPRELNPAVPAALSDLVMGLLARIPAERPPSAGAVVQALTATLTPDRIKIWDLVTRKELRRFQREHRRAADGRGIAFSADGRMLATVAHTTVKLWDVGNVAKSPRSIALGPPGGWIDFLAFSPEGRHLATANYNGTISILRLAPPASKKVGPPDRKLALPPNPGGSGLTTPEVTSVAFAPDGQTLVACTSAGTVNLWDLTRPVPPRRTVTLPGCVCAIAFAPEGRHLATANKNGTIYLFRLAEVKAAGQQANK
jgi:WD40 repeat protein